MDKRALNAATIEAIVLSIVARTPSYGYEIIKQVEELSEGEIQWAAGSLYPVLHRMEMNGHIDSFWQQPEGERRRKYYRITDEGLAALEREKQEWMRMQNLFTHLWTPSTAS